MSLVATPGQRLAAGAAALVVAFGVAVVVIDRLTPEPRGPQSSSYATAPAGLAAYADLLRRAGHRVERRRRPLADGPAVAGGTLVVLDPRAVAPREADAIGSFVRAGGRLVAGGAGGAAWLERALGPLPEWRAAGAGEARPLAPVPETAGVGAVRSVAGGAWAVAGGALPVLGPPGRPLAVVVRSGRGRALLLADASPLQNRALATADNAAFGLAAAGPGGSRVTFLETVHGYGTAGGLAALPARGRWVLLGLLLAALAFAWSRARRIGPPEEDERPLPPPRADYVDALAGALVRTRRPAEVARPLRDAARERLTARAGLGPDASEREVREAAARFGLAPEEAAALTAAPRDLDGALAAGRALARLDGAHAGRPLSLLDGAAHDAGGGGHDADGQPRGIVEEDAR